MYSDDHGGYPPPETAANQDYIEKTNPNAHEQPNEMPMASGLRYPTDTGIASANVSRDYQVEFLI